MLGADKWTVQAPGAYQGADQCTRDRTEAARMQAPTNYCNNGEAAMKHMTRIALAIGLGTALIAGASSPSLARSARAADHYYEPSDNGSAWAYYGGYENGAGGGRAQAAAPMGRAYRS